MATPSKKQSAEIAAPAAAPAAAVESKVIAFDAAKAFDFSKAIEAASGPMRDAQEQVRKAAEKAVEDSKAGYGKVKDFAEQATASVEETLRVAQNGAVEFNTKAIDVLRAQANAGFDLFAALLGAKSVSEAIQLNAEHARKQFEAASTQAKELQALAQKVAADSVEPLKGVVARVAG